MKRWQGLVAVLLVGLLFFGCSAEKSVKKLKIGDPAPLFSAPDLEGRSVSLAEYAGHPVVLRFWSTECKFCRADTPIFNYYFDKYKKQGLRVVYINRNTDEAPVREFVKDLAIVFPVVMDKDGAISKSYQIKIEPQTIVIGPDQRILAAILGGVSEAELQQLLGPYLGGEKKDEGETR